MNTPSQVNLITTSCADACLQRHTELAVPGADTPDYYIFVTENRDAAEQRAYQINVVHILLGYQYFQSSSVK